MGVPLRSEIIIAAVRDPAILHGHDPMVVWVILPAFNEAANLPPLIQGLAETLGNAALKYRILVVDDGSQDETFAVAQAYRGRLPVDVIAHQHNRGLAHALKTGLAAALAASSPADLIVTMDADNTHPPSFLLQMIERIREGNHVVIASRYARGSVEDGVPLLRRVLSRGVSVLMRLRFGLPGVRDYSSGYRVYRAQLLRTAAAAYGPRLIEGRGFAVMTELLVKLQPFHPVIAESPLHLHYSRKIGRSKVRIIRTIFEYLALLYRRIPQVRATSSPVDSSIPRLPARR